MRSTKSSRTSTSSSSSLWVAVSGCLPLLLPKYHFFKRVRHLLFLCGRKLKRFLGLGTLWRTNSSHQLQVPQVFPSLPPLPLLRDPHQEQATLPKSEVLKKHPRKVTVEATMLVLMANVPLKIPPSYVPCSPLPLSLFEIQSPTSNLANIS